jgi:hypothetical protein
MAVNSVLIYGGVLMALAGGVLRLVTIGYEYIHRGGKDKKVYAGRLVRGGVYACTRNPMYTANLLIAAGMTLATCSPVAYAVLIPFFAFVYQAIVSAEEAYLQKKFGRDYEEYCTTVNRFLPSLRSLGRSVSMRFDWKRAIMKDLSTLMGLLVGLSLLPVWRSYFLEGFVAAKAKGSTALLSICLLSGLYGFLLYLKKSRKHF